MAALVLSAKAALAAVLLVAGGAKLAGLAGFASTVRLFAPRRVGQAAIRSAALAIAACELLLGALSLALPAAREANVAVFVLCCAFLATSVIGYARFRGYSCRCFGGLSRKKFDRAAVARSTALLALSSLALAPVRATYVQLGTAPKVLLLLGAAVLACAAYTAARAVGPEGSH